MQPTIKDKLQNESGEDWELIFRAINDPVMVLDLDYRVLAANPATLKLTGMAPDKIVGSFCCNIFHCSDQLSRECPLKRLLQATKPETIDMELEILGRTFMVSVTPVFDAQGALVKAIHIARDITERKEVEERLRERKQFLSDIFASIQDGISILDTGMTIVGVNPIMERWYPHMLPLVGKKCYEAYHGQKEPCKICPSQKTLADGGAAYKVVPLRGPAGEVIGWLDLYSFPLIDTKTGQLKGVIEYVRDITKQKQIEEQLQQMQKMEAIGTLASGIAHDLNNILTPIIGNTELAILTMPPGRWQDHLNAVLVASQRAKDMVRQILTFSRKGSPIRKPLRLQPLIQDTIKLLRSLLPVSIEIRQNLDMACGPVLADATQIHQVIMNLCTNACHAMQEKGGMLEVSLSEVKLIKDQDYQTVVLPAGDFLLLTLKDTGHGMDREVLERIFEPYFTTKSESEGTGMGLSVVHGIVKSHDGVIIVHSEPGKGSIFQVYLPRIDSGSSEIFPDANGREPMPFGSERILIIDDEGPIVVMMYDIFTHLGYRITSFTNSTEALELFRAQPNDFDLVITDQAMPFLSGEELTEKMLGIRPDIPVILISGNDLSISEKKAKAIGARRFLLKPLAMNQLAVTIREILDENQRLPVIASFPQNRAG